MCSSDLSKPMLPTTDNERWALLRVKDRFIDNKGSSGVSMSAQIKAHVVQRGSLINVGIVLKKMRGNLQSEPRCVDVCRSAHDFQSDQLLERRATVIT